ncbi:MAG TPA: hypothetical protein VIY73_17110, partial [Polyangiaceae bacterium]
SSGGHAAGDDGGTGGDAAIDEGTDSEADGGECAVGADGGCIIPPDAFVSATLCNDPAFALGHATTVRPSTVEDGHAGDHVACAVHPDASGFDLSLTASGSGSALTVTSTSPVVAGGGGGDDALTVVWQSTQTGPATATNCTLTFTYEGNPVPDSPAIAAGRVWGHVSCPDVPLLATGGVTPSCDGEADILFEQCSE